MEIASSGKGRPPRNDTYQEGIATLAMKRSLVRVPAAKRVCSQGIYFSFPLPNIIFSSSVFCRIRKIMMTGIDMIKASEPI